MATACGVAGRALKDRIAGDGARCGLIRAHALPKTRRSQKTNRFANADEPASLEDRNALASDSGPDAAGAGAQVERTAYSEFRR